MNGEGRRHGGDTLLGYTVTEAFGYGTPEQMTRAKRTEDTKSQGQKWVDG